MRILLFFKIIVPPPDSQIATSKQKTKAKNQDEPSVQIAEGRYIAVFKDQAEGRISSQAADIARQTRRAIFSDLDIAGDSLIHEYLYASKGFAAHLSEEQAKVLEKDPRVKSVFPDIYYQAISSNFRSADDTTFAMQSGQTTPWGISRSGGPLDKSFSNRAWILDSGIDLDHSDLNVNTNLDTSAVSYTTSPDDDNGHGTHVAGIIAARDNSSGVVGIAPGAEVVAIKIADSNGGAYTSDLHAGVDYIANNYNQGDVANISLSYPTDDELYPWIDEPLSNLENAIEDAADDGLMFAISAGNSARDANLHSPARVNHSNVWTVSAFRQGDEFIQDFDQGTPNCGSSAIGSNYSNPPVDYSGPGENILSLWTGGGTLSTCGTSQSAPHVAGILLGCGESGLISDGSVSNDRDSQADPIARANKLYYPSNITHSVVQSSYDPDYYNPKIDWDALSGSTEYQVWRKHWEGSWKIWTTTTSTSYTDTYTNSESLQAVSYQPSQYWVAYSIRAVNECGAGSWPISPKYFKFDSDDSIPMFAEPSTK